MNRSLAQSANVVNVLAAFGLSFIIVKVFSGVLGEIRHAGLVLVHDRPAYRKVLVFTLIAGALVAVLLIITGLGLNCDKACVIQRHVNDKP
jgi:ABC-type Fe3+ transport system permease subunit